MKARQTEVAGPNEYTDFPVFPVFPATHRHPRIEREKKKIHDLFLYIFRSISPLHLGYRKYRKYRKA
jgi:hypothetical protein